MGQQHQEFQSRLQQLEKKHAAMSNGYTAKLRSDGLIVVKPQRSQSRVSGRSLLLFIAAFLLFKGFLMAYLGFDSYDARVAKLQEGSAVERAGAVLMQSDPVSQFAATKMAKFL